MLKYFYVGLATLSSMYLLAFHVFAADILAPSTTVTQTPTLPNGNNEWFTTPITFTLHATDLESGVQTLSYRRDTGVWQTTTFEDTLNLVTNPSFEELDENTAFQTYGWLPIADITPTTYQRDASVFKTGFETTAVKISGTAPGWHAITNVATFVPASYLHNMNATTWIKTDNVSQIAYFKVYAVTQGNNISTTPIAQSNTVSGTNDWGQLSANFIVSEPATIGVYLELGLLGSGTIWLDASAISESLTTATVTTSIAVDGEHTLEYYATDRNGNQETHTCLGTTKNCKTIKLDQTPPGNWHDSGAYRGVGGQAYEVYVYATVEDDTSGISTNTNSFQYFTENNATFGKYANLLNCNSTWNSNTSASLSSPAFTNGTKSAYLLTPKTSFCNNNWSFCKIVNFYAEDVAGNKGTKDFCINGPWVAVSGKGIVHANGGITMIAEADGNNTDGLIESGTSQLDFFTSSKNWYIKNATTEEGISYQQLFTQTADKLTLADKHMKNSTGIYYVSQSMTLEASSLPQDFSGKNNSQIIFVNGDLTIDKNINTTNDAAIMFVVKGDVKIMEKVTNVNAAIIADGTLYTAYDSEEGEASNTLSMHGIYVANNFKLQRTLQGTNNSKTPSEEFVYEPKYVTNLAQFYKTNEVIWLSSK